MRGTFTVRGQKVRTQTLRRYIVVRVRQPGWTRTETIKRTDNLATARAEAQRFWNRWGEETAIVDTATGEEVK